MMGERSQVVVLTRDQLDELLDEAIARARREVEDDWIGPDEVARILNVKRDTLPTLVRRDGLPCYRPGKNYTFRRSEVLEWLERRRQNGQRMDRARTLRGISGGR